MSIRVVTVRMPKQLHEALMKASHRRDQSMNFLCLDALAQDVGVAGQLDAWLLEEGLTQRKLVAERAWRPNPQPASESKTADAIASPPPASGDGGR